MTRRAARGLSVGLGLLAFAGLGCRDRPTQLLAEPSRLEEMDAPVQEQFRRLHRAFVSSLEVRGSSASEQSRAAGELGLWYHAYRYPELAEASYELAARRAPDDLRWRYLLAVLLAESDRQGEAQAHFEAVLLEEPRHLGSLVRLAELRGNEDGDETARRLFEDALEVDPRCVRALSGLAEIASRRGDPARAVRLLEQARALQPDAGGLVFRLGMAYRELGRLPRAQSLLETSRRMGSGGPFLRMNDPWYEQLEATNVGPAISLRRANAALRERNLVAALHHLRLATERAPTRVGPRLTLARVLNALGRGPEAHAELTKLVEEAPLDHQVHQVLAKVSSDLGRDAEAEGHYRRSLSLEPAFVPALVGLADSLLARDARNEEALALLRAAFEARPDSARVVERLARQLLAAGRVEEARGVLADSGLLGERSLNLLLAWVLATAPADPVGDPQRSLEIARAAFRDSPTADSVEAMSVALAALGSDQLALALSALLVEATRSQPALQAAWRARRSEQAAGQRPGTTPLALGLDNLFVDPDQVEAILERGGGAG